MRSRFADKIAEGFFVTTLNLYANIKPQVKKEMEPNFKAAYLRLYQKLVNNLNNCAKK